MAEDLQQQQALARQQQDILNKYKQQVEAYNPQVQQTQQELLRATPQSQLLVQQQERLNQAAQQTAMQELSQQQQELNQYQGKLNEIQSQAEAQARETADWSLAMKLIQNNKSIPPELQQKARYLRSQGVDSWDNIIKNQESYKQDLETAALKEKSIEAAKNRVAKIMQQDPSRVSFTPEGIMVADKMDKQFQTFNFQPIKDMWNSGTAKVEGVISKIVTPNIALTSPSINVAQRQTIGGRSPTISGYTGTLLSPARDVESAVDKIGEMAGSGWERLLTQAKVSKQNTFNLPLTPVQVKGTANINPKGDIFFKRETTSVTNPIWAMPTIARYSPQLLAYAYAPGITSGVFAASGFDKAMDKSLSANERISGFLSGSLNVGFLGLGAAAKLKNMIPRKSLGGLSVDRLKDLKPGTLEYDRARAEALTGYARQKAAGGFLGDPKAELNEKAFNLAFPYKPASTAVTIDGLKFSSEAAGRSYLKNQLLTRQSKAVNPELGLFGINKKTSLITLGKREMVSKGAIDISGKDIKWISDKLGISTDKLKAELKSKDIQLSKQSVMVAQPKKLNLFEGTVKNPAYDMRSVPGFENFGVYNKPKDVFNLKLSSSLLSGKGYYSAGMTWELGAKNQVKNLQLKTGITTIDNPKIVKFDTFVTPKSGSAFATYKGPSSYGRIVGGKVVPVQLGDITVKTDKMFGTISRGEYSATGKPLYSKRINDVEFFNIVNDRSLPKNLKPYLSERIGGFKVIGETRQNIKPYTSRYIANRIDTKSLGRQDIDNLFSTPPSPSKAKPKIDLSAKAPSKNIIDTKDYTLAEKNIPEPSEFYPTYVGGGGRGLSTYEKVGGPGTYDILRTKALTTTSRNLLDTPFIPSIGTSKLLATSLTKTTASSGNLILGSSIVATKFLLTPKTNTIQTTILQPKTRLITTQSTLQLLDTAKLSKLGTGMIQVTTPSLSQIQQPALGLLPKLGQGQQQLTRQQLSTILRSDQAYLFNPNTETRTPKTPIIKLKPKLGGGEQKKFLSKPLAKKGLFTVQLRRKGKFIDIGKSPSISKAKQIGISAAKQTLGASIRVKDLFGKPINLSPVPGFRKSKSIKDPFSIIQTKTTRLGSYGERREIKLSRTKGGFRI